MSNKKFPLKRRINDMIVNMPAVYASLALLSIAIGTLFCINDYDGTITIIQSICIAVCTYFGLMLVTVVILVHLDLDTTANFSREELRKERKKRRDRRRML